MILYHWNTFYFTKFIGLYNPQLKRSMLKYYIIFFFLIVSTIQAQNAETDKPVAIQTTIADGKMADLVSLYPNPAKDVLHVRAENIVIKRVEIFSLVGGKVKIINSNFNSIYLGDLLRGIYMVKIYSQDHYTVKKLIVK